MASGPYNREVAAQLFLSEHTVKITSVASRYFGSPAFEA